MSNSDPGTDLVKQLRGELPVAVGDPEEAARAIVNRILAAPDIESVFKMAGTLGADDVLNVPFWLRGAEFRKSDYEDGSPMYAVIEATIAETGESAVITCGGQNVIAQLIAAVRHGGEVPFPIRLTRTVKPTSNGYYPLWLEAAPAQTVES